MTTNRGKLSVVEWRFDETDVPDEELRACCYYEYARESPTICAALAGGPRSEDYRWLVSLETNEDKKYSWDFAAFFSLLVLPELKLKIPWVKQSKSLRKNLIFLVPTGSTAWIYDAGEAPSNPTDPIEAQYAIQSYDIRFDWHGSSDKEIAEYLKLWVEAIRPKDIPNKPKRGIHKYSKWRTSLENLGLMRLLHHYDFSEITHLAKNQGKKMDKYRELTKAKYAADAARENFWRYFPFLAQKNEEPIHSQLAVPKCVPKRRKGIK